MEDHMHDGHEWLSDHGPQPSDPDNQDLIGTSKSSAQAGEAGHADSSREVTPGSGHDAQNDGSPYLAQVPYQAKPAVGIQEGAGSAVPFASQSSVAQQASMTPQAPIVPQIPVAPQTPVAPSYGVMPGQPVNYGVPMDRYQPYQPQAYAPLSGQQQPLWSSVGNQTQGDQVQPSQLSAGQQQPVHSAQPYPAPTYPTQQYPTQPGPQQQYQTWQIPQSAASAQSSYPLQYSVQPYPAQPQQPQFVTQQPYQVAPVAVRPVKNPAYVKFLKQHRSVFSRIGWALVITILLWYVLSDQLVSGFGPGLVRLGMNKDDMETVLGSLPLYLVAMPLSLLLFRTLPKVQRRRSGMTPLVFLECFVMLFPIAEIGSVIGSALSGILSGGQASNRLDEALSGGSLWVTILFSTILAPIFEELFFRKLIIDRIQQYGELTAILVSSLAFGLYHANLYQFFYATAFGMLLGYIYVRTGRLRYTITLHVLFNVFGGALPELLTAGMSQKVMDDIGSANFGRMQTALSTGGPAVYGFLLLSLFNVVMFFAGIVVMVLKYKNIKLYKAPDELPKQCRVAIVLGNPGVICALIVLGLLTLAAVYM